MAKRAKRADIKYIETKSTYSEFTCPHCGVQQIGIGIRYNVTRFLCSHCGEEVIVNNRITKKLK